MVNSKRKADSAAKTGKPVKLLSEDRAIKRRKQDTKSTGDTEKKPTQTSILQNEESSFPRGGASLLTPLEHRQIQIDATNDVLFEQNTSKKRPVETFSDDGIENVQPTIASDLPQKKKKKWDSRKKKNEEFVIEKQEKIAGLGTKRLLPGTIVLGRVAQITSKEVTLALPNSLIGHITLTEISDELNKRIEKLLEDVDNDNVDDEQSHNGFDDINLPNIFYIGQFLLAYVISNGTDSTQSEKKRIELSINPRLVNTGIMGSDVVVNMAMQGSVVSVEDHGVILNFYLDGLKVQGFLPVKSIDPSFDKDIEEGATLLCLVTEVNQERNILKLTTLPKHFGNIKSGSLSNSSSIRSFTVGTLVEVLISDVSDLGFRGSIMGMIQVSSDVIHSGAFSELDMDKKFKIGSKVKARITYNVPKDEESIIGVSVLDSILNYTQSKSSNKFNISEIIEEAKVVKVQSSLGIFLQLAPGQPSGFAHISRISDKRIDSISSDTGSYKLGSKHRVRIIGFNTIDGLYLVSLQESVLNQPFLRLEDVSVGMIVQGTVNKFVLNENGVGGLLVKLAEGIIGLVPEIHLADVHLQHPEKKFKEGIKVKARILSVNLEKRQMRLTLKKSLVNSDIEPWLDFTKIKQDSEGLGTLINILPDGAVVQFYGNVRAFLPVSEMSESFIKDARQHFKTGQVIKVRAMEIHPETRKMTVSSKPLGEVDPNTIKAFNKTLIGKLVKGSITEISEDIVSLELENNVTAFLKLKHLTDGSTTKCKSAMNKLRVGQTLTDLIVIDKQEKRHTLVVSNKPKMLQAVQARKLCTKFKDLKRGNEYVGFVRNITGAGIFVEFAGQVTTLLPVSQLSESTRSKPDFGYEVGDTITAFVDNIDATAQRASLTFRSDMAPASEPIQDIQGEIVNPVDKVSTSFSDFTLGKVTTAKIVNVKKTQLNVKLADNVQGRIDISELFDDWKDIKDRKHPTCIFKASQIIDVKIIGVHGVKGHKFLPFSHRTVRSVYELSAKNLSSPHVMTLSDLKFKDQVIGYVNNYVNKAIWVNLSPSMRGVVHFNDLSEDTNVLENIEENFPLGSAIKLTVISINPGQNKLELSALGDEKILADSVTVDQLSIGSMYTGRITHITPRTVLVRLNKEITGAITLTELSDDYSEVKTDNYQKNQKLRIKIVDIDLPNKKVFLSSRRSQVFDSKIKVQDRQILKFTDVNVGDVLRGFVAKVTDYGLLVGIGPNVAAYVRIADISDGFIKEWQSIHSIDDLVEGKVLQVDQDTRQILFSLKESVLDPNYVQPLTFEDFQLNQVVTGKVRKVEKYGVFIVVDNSNNVSGLCHRSEIADSKIEDVTKLYDEGDIVKAIILKIDKSQRKVNFGLKASYFKDSEDADDSDNVSVMEDDEVLGVDAEEKNHRKVMDMQEIDELFPHGSSDENEENQEDDDDNNTVDVDEGVQGLSTGGFDWSGEVFAVKPLVDANTSSVVTDLKKKKKKSEIQIDRTGELDKFGPKTVADFERLLLGKPNDSTIWIQYMAFQLGLGELDKARAIAERALQTINLQDQDEKLNVWVALLNLENTYGSADSVEQVFKRACEYQDKDDMHERLISIFIESGQHSRAEELFQKMTKLKTLSSKPSFWLNYATFLLTTASRADAARALLLRATQSVPSAQHRALTAKFAALEFAEHRGGNGNGDAERGRTVFEGLLSAYPRRADLWDMYIDLERGCGNVAGVRALFERVARMKMKTRRAMFVFKRWLEFEESEGDEQSQRRVKQVAAEYAEKMAREKEEADE